MSNILNNIITKIRNCKTGTELRKNVTEGFENINSRLFKAEEIYNQSVEDGGNSNREIVDARVDEVYRKSFETLGKRLTEMSEKIKELESLETKIDDKYARKNRIILTLDNVNPGTYLPGTWILIGQGKDIAGVGTGTDKNGLSKTIVPGNNQGEYKHKITMKEVPMHTTKDEGLNGYGLDINGSYENRVIITKNASEQSDIDLSTPKVGLYIWQRVS